jgi:LAO/AO transport system kinase
VGRASVPAATKAAVSGKALLNASDQMLADGVLARQTKALAKAITLVESTRPDHQARAGLLLEALFPHTGRSIRLGISGAPGVGKSTFIEALGLHVIGRGHSIAVLSVDPSSAISGGSILGDKTRMEQLARSASSFIRPSPARGSIGGVAAKTREAMLVCEAAGFDVVVVETVGVGQSETTVAGMVDVFVLLQLPNAGDDLQAIKKGIIELADLVVINKADIDPAAALVAKHQFEWALSILQTSSPNWHPAVLALSALQKTGIDAFWTELERFRKLMTESGELEAKRRRQALDWMWALIDRGLHRRFREHPDVRRDLDAISQSVARGNMAATAAACRLLEYLDGQK